MMQLELALKQLNITYDENMLCKFQDYMKEILKWNKMVNLTSICEEEEFIDKHYIDSLFCVKTRAYQSASNIIDVGTGGGFPGVPLAIISPDKEFILIDSLNKRIKIVNEICEKIGIINVTAVHGRAEELGNNKKYREKFDLCVSRAVANLSVLAEYCLPFVKNEGFFISYKGLDCDKEIEESKKAISVLGGSIVEKATFNLSNCDLKHQIIIIEKKSKTPSKYPRKAGTPSKEPLI